MPLLFRIVARAVKSGCDKIEILYSSGRLELRLHGLRAPVDVQESDDLMERANEGEVERFLLRSSQFDFPRLELQKRLNSAPVPVYLNGSQLNHGVDMSRANDYIVSRRYFLATPERAHFCTQPVWDAEESNFKLPKKAGKLCWSQDAYFQTEEGPEPPSTSFPWLKVGSGYQGIPCHGMVALGYNLDKPSSIHWIENGVWLDSQEVDLGFPGAWAVCSADGLAREGFRVNDSPDREVTVAQARREVEYLLMDTLRFRGLPYPKFPSVSRTLFFLAGLGAGWYTGLLWPFIAGPIIGESLEWFHHFKAKARFWKAVDAWQSDRGRSIAATQEKSVEA